MKFIFVFLALLFVTPASADDGIITKSSNHSVKDTISRFAAAVKSREGAGFIVFTEIDHAAAGKKVGIDMRPRTVVIFGNPKLGTPVMAKTPLLAIDNPPKALVWEDDQGRYGCLIIQPTICIKQSTRGMDWRLRPTTRRSRRS